MMQSNIDMIETLLDGILQDPGSQATEILKKRLEEAIQSNNSLKKENGELKTKVNFLTYVLEQNACLGCIESLTIP